MKAITLRNLPPELSREIESRSQILGLSLNKTVLKLLQEALLPQEDAPLGARRHDDLDELAGSWSEAEAAEFDRSLEAQRQIDPELWR